MWDNEAPRSTAYYFRYSVFTMGHKLRLPTLDYISFFMICSAAEFLPTTISADFYLEFERNQVGNKSVNYGNYEAYFMFTQECMEELKTKPCQHDLHDVFLPRHFINYLLITSSRYISNQIKCNV